MAGLIVALDDDDLVAAEGLARHLTGAVDAFKVGLTLFAAHGPEALFEIGQHGKVFCDLKLHDIPTQVRGAAKSLASKGVWLTTVHASGGRAMVAAAVSGAAGSGTLVAAVTVLTSLDAAELGALGFGGDPASQVLRLAELAVGAGAQALVCSPQEVAAVRAAVGPGVLLVTPGVRQAGGELGDQSRVATPSAAVAAGADYLVVGRPITAAARPRGAAEAIRAEMGA